MTYIVKIRVATDSFHIAEAVAKEAASSQPNPTAPGATSVLAIYPEEPPRYCARCSDALVKGGL